MLTLLLSTAYAATLTAGSGAPGYDTATEFAADYLGVSTDYAAWVAINDGSVTHQGIVIGTTEGGVERARILVWGYCEPTSGYTCFGGLPVIAAVSRSGTPSSGGSSTVTQGLYHSTTSNTLVNDATSTAALSGNVVAGTATLSISNGFGRVTTSWSGGSSWLTPRVQIDQQTLDREIAKVLESFRDWLDEKSLWGDEDHDGIPNYKDLNWESYMPAELVFPD